jgi:hypothetical protein
MVTLNLPTLVLLILSLPCFAQCWKRYVSALSKVTGRRMDRSRVILTHPGRGQNDGMNRGWTAMKPVDRHNLDLARARFACDAAAFALGCDEALLSDKRGDAHTAFARQVAMYLTHVAFGMSLQRVGFAFARDRSTVAYACHLIEDKRDDAALDELLDQLEASLRAAPSPTMLKMAA